MYEVYISKAAGGDLNALSGALRDRLVKRIKSLADDPRPSGCRKIVGSQDDWRVRVGDYRIIYEINDGLKRVNVMRVKHRREAYR